MRSLLMGGQACVFYGAAEFSRDLDLLLLLDPENLLNLESALQELQAGRIAIPEMNPDYLSRGHAVHFRCHLPGVENLRVDIMSKLRGVEDFDTLWTRRTTVEIDGEIVEMLSLPDLVQAKKTQRDKDWPMIRRLVEQTYYAATSPTQQQVDFLLAELRSPDLLITLARTNLESAQRSKRNAVKAAIHSDLTSVEASLKVEEQAERVSDQQYWAPLKMELEQFRRTRSRPND